MDEWTGGWVDGWMDQPVAPVASLCWVVVFLFQPNIAHWQLAGSAGRTWVEGQGKLVA